ncbi:hypothetical protein F4780DRAFT_458738 [Xylariomycetidae sp. FL0641]|nr:hypothetical protein F4780DRAFT_458738 [Xylariomycetidae sp. FL0641]
MQKRRSHKKSRHGCLNCKRWHTKCDELGPPCTNCALRKAKCEYAWRTNSKPLGLPLAREGSTSSGASSSAGLPSTTCIHKPASLEQWESRRVLELELMHLWSTSTYKCLSSMPEDTHYLQMVLPREALSYDFLLDGVLVASALQRSTVTGGAEAQKYLQIAMELYIKASSSFRVQLGHMTPANHHVLYMFSTMAAFFNLAFFTVGNERQMDALSVMTLASHLMTGSISIAKANFDQLLASPIPLRTYLTLGTASPDLLDQDTKDTLARLKEFNNSYLPPNLTADPRAQQDGSFPQWENPFREVIDTVELCFAEDARGVMQGYCCTFVAAAGQEYAQAIKVQDPMALFILMHCAVLLERISDSYWWVKDLGKHLIAGISATLRDHHPHLAYEWRENIRWIRRQIGWPDLP